MTSREPSWRQFVALCLPGDALDPLVAWQAQITAAAGRGPVRPVARDALHLTLAFLGDRTPTETDIAKDAIDTALAGLRVPSLRFEPRARTLPPRRPRLVAAALTPEDALMALRGHVALALRDSDVFEDEGRPFWPHITICRARHRLASRLTDRLPEAPSELVERGFAADRCVLFRSRLSAGPPRYEVLAEWRLSGPD